MVDIPRLSQEEQEPQWKKEVRGQLAELKADAKKAAEEWGKRWFLSLAIGNAGGLVAMSGAALNIAAKSEAANPLYWVILPAAWSFAIGMIAGAVLPYCWKKKVEKVTDWVWVRHQELEDDGPTQVYVDEEPEFSRDLLKEYDDHQKRWDKYFGYCERTAVLGFLTALTWTLTCFTIFAIIR